MTETPHPYYASVPLPLDVELGLRKRAGEGNAGFHRTMAQIQLSNSGRSIEASKTTSLGGMTMIGRIHWVHDEGRWYRWQYFGMGKGWLATESRSTWSALGKPTRDNWRLRRELDEYNKFSSAAEQFAHEKKQEAAGLKLTARYRAARERALAKAGFGAGSGKGDGPAAAEDYSPVSPNT